MRLLWVQVQPMLTSVVCGKAFQHPANGRGLAPTTTRFPPTIMQGAVE